MRTSKIHVSYVGALDFKLDAKIRRAAGLLAEFLGSGYEVSKRCRDLQFRSKSATDAHVAAERIKQLPFNLDVLVL
jgi:hypothetical protein